MKKIIIFIFISVDCIIGALPTLNFKCPQYVQRYIQSQVVCPRNPLDYSCLCNTENTTCSTRNEEVAHEYCSNDKPEFAGIGQKYVWSGGLRNIKCPSERFQPPGFNLWQNVSSQCIFLKSFCNEEGQVIHINGSAEKDVSCRCDHTRGYAFVANNNTDKSSCKSLEEDCSCYTKKCLFKETLAKDYSCILSSNKNILSRNHPVVAATRQSTVEHVDLTVNITENKYRINYKNGITALIFLFIIFGSCLMIVFLLCDLNIKCKDYCSDRKELVLNHEGTRQPSTSFDPQLDDHLQQPINCTAHQLDGANSGNDTIHDELSFNKEMTTKRSSTQADCDHLQQPINCTVHQLDGANSGNETIHDELSFNTEMTTKRSSTQADCDHLQQPINCTVHQLDGANSGNETIHDELSFNTEMTTKRSSTQADCDLGSDSNCLQVQDINTNNTQHLHDTDISAFDEITEEQEVLIDKTEILPDKLSVCDVSAVSSYNDKRNESSLKKVAMEKSFSDKTISVVVYPQDVNQFVGFSCRFNTSMSSIDGCIRKIEWLHITPEKEITCDLENTKKYGTDDPQSFTIRSLAPEDAGTYVCRVSNIKETVDSEHIKLNVKDFNPKIYHWIERPNQEKTILKFNFDVPQIIDITLILKTNDTDEIKSKPTNVAPNESFITCDFPICCSGKYEIVLETYFGAVIKRTIDLRITSDGEEQLQENWSLEKLLMSVQKDAKKVTAIPSKIDCTQDIDRGNQTTTNRQEEATSHNSSCTETLVESHETTTDEKSEAISQNPSYTEILNKQHEPTTDDKREKTASMDSVDQPHQLRTDYLTESNQSKAAPMKCLNKPSVRAVIALDIGTTHSRYAVLIPETPFIEEKIESVFKDSVPTAVLFNVTLDNFVACGDKAIKEYKSAVQRDEQKSYIMFEKFKLELYKRMEVTAKLEIKDVYERTMLATKVYTAVINDLKQRALMHIKQKNNTIHNDEIVWVMTAPDIWKENAKDIIRLCCELSGITKEQLIVVDDSNAILAYFQKVQSFCRETLPQNVDDKNYLLIDLSGGTCDITGYHTPADCDVGVPIRPSHKLCGVDIVCNVILDRLSSIIGENAMDCLKKEETSSYLQLKEACIQLCLTSDNSLNVPIQTFDNLCTRFREMSFKEAVDGYGKTVSGSDSEQVDIDFTLFRNKLIVRKGLVDNSLKKIIGTAINEIENILKTQKAQNIQQFFIVGGFSSLSIVQNEIQDAFKDKSVIFANDKVFSSVKGALVYGYEKTNI
ncbi:uncharacterized protein [Mytilus edulis]|uniref:uncharacterized protein isoform X3 n=1 Tax=Mytilus edulis TaxID=6550 RepID=UPI0039F096E0